MAPGHSRLQDYKNYKWSQKNLEASRRTGYDSKSSRALPSSEFIRITGGPSAYTWQIDMAEALLLGLDCSVIAGTGAGKTMPFVMPLFIEREKCVLVISPLNALEEDQAEHSTLLG
ncbi:hypothetical protein F5878DRAFT_624112 [Lentinula raphanica]|uniref:DEAD/DEAH-box helicase domain-containing protein n=1 Tax=Lentinula raphanica TaxID=153919 RepID=A0AA38UCH7_9AGAR|nr:hypothetical protein F5878DRAFT_624112 [Lentinula raphanica]